MSSPTDSTITIESSEEARSRSPLWMVSQEPLLNDLVSYLGTIKDALQSKPNVVCKMKFSRAHLLDCRAAFDRMIRKGEEGLHRLCELFCQSFVGPFQSQSVVLGEVASTGERFTLTQPIATADLYSTMDLDLGTRQLRKLQYFDGKNWVSPELVANVVEYQPTQPNKYGVQKIISRIKAEEELWNKVVDEIFHLDALVNRDKELRHLSKYVKDIFGVKIVVSSVLDAASLHETLKNHSWSDGELSSVGLADFSTARTLRFVETKNYVTGHDKQSGWEAIKSVVSWSDKVFEIQVQSLSNYWREREYLTRESHAGFKNRREQVRQQVAAHIPLFGFYQELLQWLFSDPNAPAPSFPGVTVALVD
jgi:hypothetical protein